MKKLKIRAFDKNAKKMFYDDTQHIEVGLGKCIHAFVYQIGLIYGTTSEFIGIQDIEKLDLYDGDIVTYTDFRGVHTTAQSKHDGYIQGWIGVIRWSDSEGWYLDKKNIHNDRILTTFTNEKEKRSNPYHYRMKNISKVKPLKAGNIYQNAHLLNHFDYKAIKDQYEQYNTII